MARTALLFGCILGAGSGLLASVPDALGVKIVMMSIGALAGVAISGAFSRLRRRKPPEHDPFVERTFPAHDPALTHWRDTGEIYPMPGHPDPEGGRHERP